MNRLASFSIQSVVLFTPLVLRLAALFLGGLGLTLNRCNFGFEDGLLILLILWYGRTRWLSGLGLCGLASKTIGLLLLEISVLLLDFEWLVLLELRCISLSGGGREVHLVTDHLFLHLGLVLVGHCGLHH